MEVIPVVCSHQLLGITSIHLGSQGNKVNNVGRRARTRVMEPRAARIQSTFSGSCKVRLHSSSRSYTSYVCRSQLIEDFTPAASAVYGVLLLGGGLFAYTKSGSKGSLFGGLTGAILMSVAYYLMQALETKELGDALAFGASLLFAFIFGIRFAATRKIIPAGLLLGVSISLTAVAFSAYLQDRF